ncbi:MAG: HEAT repeat domain-containing protein [Planctomycetia bacterium]|nr:HEAT repeat domain-containing protein [Planctomycetia bacterium]
MSNWRFILLTISLHLPVITNAAAPPTRIDSSKVSQLLRQLDDDEFDVRQTADFELRRMGKPVIPYLREEQLRTPSLEVRDRINKIVRDLRADEKIPDLIQQLNHRDARFRNHAIYSLNRLTTDQLPALEAALQRGISQEAKQVLQQVIAELRR